MRKRNSVNDLKEDNDLLRKKNEELMMRFGELERSLQEHQYYLNLKRQNHMGGTLRF
jgi:vacuolar-type H+-ATPase subunit D/Vma8